MKLALTEYEEKEGFSQESTMNLVNKGNGKFSPNKDVLTLQLLFSSRVSMVEFVLKVYVRNLRPQVPEFENVLSVPSGAD